MARAYTHPPRFSFKRPVPVGIEGLTDHQRDIVHMRCVDELTNPQIGERLRIRPDTVKTITTTILQKTGHRVMCGLCVEYGRTLERKVPLDSLRSEDV